jgi:SAM-dependent methyltransferase
MVKRFFPDFQAIRIAILGFEADIAGQKGGYEEQCLQRLPATSIKDVMKRHLWPKAFPALTLQQEAISQDFVKHWHEILPRFGFVEKFNHDYPAKNAVIPKHCRTLEVGAGLGGHLAYENLTTQDYHCIELRRNMAEELKRRFPHVSVVTGDCQIKMPFPEAYFNRIIAIHVLEHLPDLPRAIHEMHRVLAGSGTLDIVIPCDPGLLYSIGRKVSAERVFKQRYKQDYAWFIKREHINSPAEIITLLKDVFVIRKRRYFPFRVFT